MKKYLYSVIAILILSTGCEDFVDIEQPGRLGEAQAFENTTDIEAGKFGVYSELDYSSQIQFNALFTDMLSIGFDNGGQGLDGSYAFVLNPQSAIATALWTRYYGALNNLNRVLVASETIEVQEGEEDRFDDAVAQLYALRAFIHFELLTYFSPDLTDDSALGVILMDFVPSVDQELPRATTGEIFQLISADLDLAESLIVTESDPIIVSADFITALRARINAYRGNYAVADGFAAELLSKYSISDRDTYEQIFTDEAIGEVIFKLERTIGDDFDGQGATGSAFAGGWAGANFAFVNATVEGSPYFEMSNSVFNDLSEDDIRYDVLVEPTSIIEENRIAVGKYRGSEGQPLLNDLKIFRASEMLFIRAEAAATANQPAQAAAFIQQLRDARFGSPQPAVSYTNVQAAFAGILAERKIELAYEGFRWVDLKRLNARAGLNRLVRNAQDCAINGACQLDLSSIEAKAIPIPLVELNANDVIQQTDGY